MEFRIPAGSPKFFDLEGARHQFETPAAPCLVDPVRWSMGRNQSAEQDIAVQYDAHQARRAHSRASSIAPSIASDDTPALSRSPVRFRVPGCAPGRLLRQSAIARPCEHGLG